MDGEYLQEVAGPTHTFTVHNRDEAGNLSTPSNALTVRYVDLAANRSAESPPVTLDHGMRC